MQGGDELSIVSFLAALGREESTHVWATESLTSLVLTVSPPPVLPAGCGMTPTELAFNNPASLCLSEFGDVLLDADDLALPTERADGEATAPLDCLDGVSDRTGRNMSSRSAKSSSSTKSKENRNTYSLNTAYKTKGLNSQT